MVGDGWGWIVVLTNLLVFHCASRICRLFSPACFRGNRLLDIVCNALQNREGAKERYWNISKSLT